MYCNFLKFSCIFTYLQEKVSHQWLDFRFIRIVTMNYKELSIFQYIKYLLLLLCKHCIEKFKTSFHCYQFLFLRYISSEDSKLEQWFSLNQLRKFQIRLYRNILTIEDFLGEHNLVNNKINRDFFLFFLCCSFETVLWFRIKIKILVNINEHIVTCTLSVIMSLIFSSLHYKR